MEVYCCQQVHFSMKILGMGKHESPSSECQHKFLRISPSVRFHPQGCANCCGGSSRFAAGKATNLSVMLMANADKHEAVACMQIY